VQERPDSVPILHESRPALAHYRQVMADVMALADLATPWSIRVAVTLRLAEHIDSGVCDVAPLAEVVGCDAERLWALLAHLSDRGIFTAAGKARYEMNDAARQLLDPNVQRVLDLNGIGGRFAGIYSTLLEFVRTGQTQYTSAFGLAFFEDLAVHPHLGETFDAMMAEGHGDAGRVPQLTAGWENVQWVVDVGGGKGHVVTHILRAHPKMRATLIELPETAERAAAFFDEAGLATRAEAIGQSFFDPLPAGADVYMLIGVLNDWPDAEASVILRRCAEAVRPGGRVLVGAGVRGDDEVPRNQIDKLVTGGRDRPLSEFRAMAEAAGLAVVNADGGLVECEPIHG
jgi:2,7-dihydroxy-5-methyl-1-naphthoate 7-O-methyltransferase